MQKGRDGAAEPGDGQRGGCTGVEMPKLVFGRPLTASDRKWELSGEDELGCWWRTPGS